VARRARRARRHRIAVASGAFVVVAATGLAVPALWSGGGGVSSLSTGDGGKAATKPAATKPSAPVNMTAKAERPPLQPVKLPHGIELPLESTATPAGYGPFVPSVADDGDLAMVSDNRVTGLEVTFGATRPAWQPDPADTHTQADVNGRTADVYQGSTGAAVLWRRKADQWVLVLEKAKNPQATARAEVLQVARGLVDSATPTQHRVLFTQAPSGYQYVDSSLTAARLAPNGKSDEARQITATLVPAGRALPAGRSFTYHGRPAVLVDNTVADVDLGNGQWLQVRFGPGATLPADDRPQLVIGIVILPAGS